MEPLATNFIIVDDDCINNLIYGKIIQHVFPDAYIQTFTVPEEALNYIQSTHTETPVSDTILFLDINMPSLSGWAFVDIFDQFDYRIKKHFKIYMLSSSIEPRDKQRAANNINVSDYFEKPLTKQNLESLWCKS